MRQVDFVEKLSGAAFGHIRNPLSYAQLINLEWARYSAIFYHWRSVDTVWVRMIHNIGIASDWEVDFEDWVKFQSWRSRVGIPKPVNWKEEGF